MPALAQAQKVADELESNNFPVHPVRMIGPLSGSLGPNGAPAKKVQRRLGN